MSIQSLLDMDGVLVDFVGGACRLHGRANPYLSGYRDWLICESPEFNGMSMREFCAPMGREFWASLDWTEDGREILACVEAAFGPENVCILSAPMLTDGCIDGKRDWINKHIPQYKTRYLFGNAKHFAAAPGRFLIDDRDDNIIEYRKCLYEMFPMPGTIQANEALLKFCDAHAILVPRPWNGVKIPRVVGGVESLKAAIAGAAASIHI